MAEGSVYGGYSNHKDDQVVRYASVSQDEESEVMELEYEVSAVEVTKYFKFVYGFAAVASLVLFIAFVVDVSKSEGPLRIVSPKESGLFWSTLASMVIYGAGIVVAALQVWQVKRLEEKFLKPIWFASLSVTALYIFLVITSLMTIVVFDMMGKKKASGPVIGGHLITVGFFTAASAALSLSTLYFRLIIVPSYPDAVSIAPMDALSSDSN